MRRERDMTAHYRRLNEKDEMTPQCRHHAYRSKIVLAVPWMAVSACRLGAKEEQMKTRRRNEKRET